MIYYEFFKEEYLLIVRYEDKIGKDELIQFFSFIFKYSDKIKTKGVLNDLRTARFDFDLPGMKEAAEARLRESEKYSDFKSVHLTNESHQTMYSVIFREQHDKRDSQWITCLTTEYAKYYLGLEMDIELIEERIKSLKNQFIRKVK